MILKNEHYLPSETNNLMEILNDIVHRISESPSISRFGIKS